MAGTSYTRQSTFADGDTITAALFNDEYNQLVNAFSYASSGTTGHRHDGTSGEGGNIHVIGDEDFLNKISVDSINNRWGFYVEVSAAAVEQIRIQDGAIVPVTDDDIDLGTSSLEFKNLYLDGTATIDTLTVDGAATVGTTLGVTGATTLSSTLGVTGAATFDGNVTIGNAATDTLTITADVSSNILPSADSTYTLGDSSNYWSHGYIDAVTTTGNVSIGGNLTVTGNATISGNLTFGDADTDSITLTADVASHVTPDIDDTYDLGSVTKEWRNLYVDGTAYVDAINFNGTAITATGSELNTLAGITATVSELNTLDGITATVTELNYTDGVTSNIQTQLNNKQPLDADLTTIAALSNADSNFIVGSSTGWVVESGATARTSLGLGSLATASTISNSDWSGTDLEIANGGTGASTASAARTNLGVAIGTDVQAYDAGLASISSLTTSADKMIYTTALDTYAVTSLSSFGRSLVDDADAATARATLGLVIGTNVQAYDPQLADVAGLTPTDGNFIVGNGTNFVAESGATARASLGLIIGTDVQAYSAVLAATTASFTTAEETKLAGIQAGAQVNDPTTLLDADIGVSVLAYDSNLQSFVTTFEVPTADGTSGQALITDGSGNISFGDVDALPSQTGNSGYYLTTDGTTASWGAISIPSYTYVRTNFTATAAQTTFTVSYTVGYVDVYMNGVKLIVGTDVTATNGTSIVLASGAAAGDLIEVVAFQTFNVANALTTSDLGVSVQAYDADTTKNDVANTFTADQTISGELIVDSYNESYNAVTSTTNATTVDCETGNVFSHTLTENTTFTFSNPPASGTAYAFSLRIIQDASASGYAVTWPGSVDWASATAPTLTATASAVDWLVFSTVDGGTTWYGFVSGQALA